MTDLTEDEMKAIIAESRKFHEERQNGIQVVYHSSCKKCAKKGLQYLYLLDRFPMSKEIITICPNCKKGDYAKISDPILFHDPINNEDYDLKKMCLNFKCDINHFQYPWICKYMFDHFINDIHNL